jgi:hypothetical protein
MAVKRKNRLPESPTSKVANCDLGKTRASRVESVKERICVVRGQRVMLDHDLAKLYGVATKRLNQQLRRNIKRFPEDFAFRLTLREAKEITASRLQSATLKQGHNIKHPPHVFTEHGAIMLASVLNSRTAVQASIYVVRAFVDMRTALLEYADLSRRIDQLEAQFDDRFQQVFEAIRALIGSPHRPLRPIGFIDAPVQKRKKERP